MNLDKYQIFYKTTDGNLIGQRDLASYVTLTIDSNVQYEDGWIMTIKGGDNESNIQGFTFDTVSRLKEVVLNPYVTYTTGVLFKSCSNLEKVTFTTTNPFYIGDGEFMNCPKLKMLEVNSSYIPVFTLYNEFYGCQRNGYLVTNGNNVSELAQFLSANYGWTTVNSVNDIPTTPTDTGTTENPPSSGSTSGSTSGTTSGSTSGSTSGGTLPPPSSNEHWGSLPDGYIEVTGSTNNYATGNTGNTDVTTPDAPYQQVFHGKTGTSTITGMTFNHLFGDIEYIPIQIEPLPQITMQNNIYFKKEDIENGI